jgi:hypothetical protein
MFTVGEIYKDAKKILGSCDDETLFRRVTESIELLSNAGDFDPLIGVVDICVQDCCVTLPRDIENVLAVNISGRPSFGRDRLFNFHLNGPGDDCKQTCHWAWTDGGDSPVFRDLIGPRKLLAFVTNPEDANSELWAYGTDKAGNFVRTKEGANWVDGYRVPTVFGFAMPEVNAPEFQRIFRVRKAVTTGPIRLSSIDNDGITGTLLGQYQWDETEPLYRRIKLSQAACWVRIAFRRAIFKVTSKLDLIPLHVSRSLTTMLRALKAYDDDDVTLGLQHESNARRWLEEEQRTRTPPVSFPIQVADRNLLVDRCDQVD